MFQSRNPWTLLTLLLALGLVAGCYTRTARGGSGGDDDDAVDDDDAQADDDDASEDDDDASEDDDDAQADDDDAQADDDDAHADDDDAHADDDDAHADDDDAHADDDDAQPDDDDVVVDDDDDAVGCAADEVVDCNGVCAPEDWIGDTYCDDGSYEYGGNLIDLDCAAHNYDDGDCVVGDDDDDVVVDDDDATPDPTLPPFADDCTPGLNDDMASAAGIQAIDGQTYSGEICAGDVDVYVMYLPANTWASVEIEIDGTGQGTTDLDLYELETNSTAHQSSARENSYERLAVYNETGAVREHHFAVVPYNNAVADYDIIIAASPYHEGMECDSFYSSSPLEGGPCNYVMQWPRSNGTFESVWPEHPPIWSSVRREVQYLVRWAADEVMDQYPGTTPLAVMDMSEKDGSTPGTLEGSMRHPAGTHNDGNDMDIAYYQNDGDNNGEIVCPSNDGQWCTGPATLLDAERTAYFMAQLYLHPNVRVLGVDTTVAADVTDAADDLLAAGLITSSQRNYFDTHMASGVNWPFHHHHIHFSWDWESGWSAAGQPIPDGCMMESSLVELPGKQPTLTIVEAFGR